MRQSIELEGPPCSRWSSGSSQTSERAPLCDLYQYVCRQLAHGLAPEALEFIDRLNLDAPANGGRAKHAVIRYPFSPGRREGWILKDEVGVGKACKVLISARQYVDDGLVFLRYIAGQIANELAEIRGMRRKLRNRFENSDDLLRLEIVEHAQYPGGREVGPQVKEDLQPVGRLWGKGLHRPQRSLHVDKPFSGIARRERPRQNRSVANFEEAAKALQFGGVLWAEKAANGTQ